MRNNSVTEKALIWITDILKKHNIPFQITGGFAARIYGTTRPLADIDIDIPEDEFDVVKPEVLNFITYGPANYKSDKFDLLLMTLNYHGQEIDLSGAYTTKVFNEKTGLWQTLIEDLSQVVMKPIWGLHLPVISKNTLIAYKKILSRPVDVVDINELEKIE